jgi:hypothetical protein
LNHGSPTNVVAGQGAGNMEELMQYYAEKKQAEASSNERKRILEEK